MRLALILAAVGVALVVVGWVGLQIQPTQYPAFPQRSGEVKTIPLPKGLPAPVERFFRQVYGENIGVITSAVITGRATMRPVGPVSLPARFRFTHVAGQGYRHFIEATLFGFPVMTANERYVDGRGRMEISLGMVDEGERFNQGANLGMWAESIWFPSIYLTDPRVAWEPLDENTAILIVPYGENKEHYVVRFDPLTGLITWLESMRYHASDSPAKTLWLNQTVEWGTRDGKPFSVSGAAIWMDDGKPWAVFTVEDIVYNVDVQQYIQATGP